MMRMAVAALAACLMGAPAQAQDLPGKAGAARTVAMFDLFCFSQLPDIAVIADIAEGNFEELEGEEREKYASGGPPGALRAWKYLDFDQEYVLVTQEAEPDEALKSGVPEFADATSYACSLILPRQDPQADIQAEMATLLAREPDASWDQPPLKARSWSARDENLLVQVFHYAPLDGGPGGVLRAVSLVKN